MMRASPQIQSFGGEPHRHQSARMISFQDIVSQGKIWTAQKHFRHVNPVCVLTS